MKGWLLLGGGAGILLGLLFFGGLWLTVKRLASSRRPVLLALGSYWSRTVMAAGAAVYFARRSWPSAVALLAGFLLGRLVVTAWTRAGRTLPKCT